MKVKITSMSATLVLEDGTRFFGQALGERRQSNVSEICFTTSMTGYQHTITDPSFAGQIIVFSFPHIGNVGINDFDNERTKVFAQGIVIANEPSAGAHPLSHNNLDEWLKSNKVVGISDLDTRALINHVRTKNKTVMGAIFPGHTDADLPFIPSIEVDTLVDEVINQDPLPALYTASGKGLKIALIDFGVKFSIIKRLNALDCQVFVVPGKPGFAQEALNLGADGIVLANGPGDPKSLSSYSNQEINHLIASKIPILGICLGHQLLALASGISTVKMEGGHRGSNHPVFDTNSGKISITSQNHGYAIRAGDLGERAARWLSLFDQSVEGVIWQKDHISSVQYHPEGGPGTHDNFIIFEDFLRLVQANKSAQRG